MLAILAVVLFASCATLPPPPDLDEDPTFQSAAAPARRGRQSVSLTRGQALENVDVVRQNGRSWTGYGGYGI